MSSASEPTHHRIANTLAYCTAYIGLGLVFAAVGPTLPGLAEMVGAPLSAISAIFVGRSLGFLVGAGIGGRVYDHLPGHPIMAGMLLLAAAAMALVPLSSTVWMLAVLFTLLGLGEGVFDVGGNTLLIWNHPTNLAPWMNGLHFCFGLGAFLSTVIIARALLIDDSIRWPYWILASMLLPLVVWVLCLKSPPIRGRAAEARAAANAPLTIFLVALLLATAVGVEAGFSSWVASYALKVGIAADKSAAAYLTSWFWGAFALGRLAGVPIATRVRPSRVLAMDFAACAAGPVVVLLWPASPTALCAGAIITGAAVASMFAMTFALASRRLTITGGVASWFFVGASFGGMGTPWIIGQLFETVGPQVVMYVILTDLVLAVAVFAVLMRHRPGGSE